MKIITLDIYPESKKYIKNFIIKYALEHRNKYVEMEDEILIDMDVLIRIRELKEIVLNEKLFERPKQIQPFEFIDDILLIEQPNYKNNQNKKELKRQSKLVNNKLKNYNQRRR